MIYDTLGDLIASGRRGAPDEPFHATGRNYLDDDRSNRSPPPAARRWQRSAATRRDRRVALHDQMPKRCCAKTIR